MSERLKVTLAGGTVEYLELSTTNAQGLESLIRRGDVEAEWLPIEGGKGVAGWAATSKRRSRGKPGPAEQG